MNEKLAHKENDEGSSKLPSLHRNIENKQKLPESTLSELWKTDQSLQRQVNSETTKMQL